MTFSFLLVHPVYINDSVRMQFGKIWIPEKVIEKLNNRSYTVQTQRRDLQKKRTSTT